MADVLMLVSDLRLLRTPATLAELIRFEEPLISRVKSLVKASVAPVREFAPVRIFPRLMRVVMLSRSIPPVDLKML